MTSAGERDSITRLLAENAVQLEKLLEKQEHLEGRVVAMDERLKEAMDERLKEIERMATTYKGGFVAVLTMGAVMGWIMNNLTWIKAIFTVKGIE